MRARRGLLIGWGVVALFGAALVVVSVAAVREPDLDRTASSTTTEVVDAGAVERFEQAWERSRTGTFVAVGTYERTSEVTGATISSQDVVAQRPPRRVHRQLGGVDGRDDDRLIVCPAPPDGVDEREPCRFGPSGGETYTASVAREVAGVRSLTAGADPLYGVREDDRGCFVLTLLRPDPRAPFGVRASFCFDDATGAVVERSVRHETGIVETLDAVSVRPTVTDTDLEP